MNNQCTNCGQANAAESKFCRFCGSRMPDPYFQPADPMTHRRPYSWQTDEFQTRNEARIPPNRSTREDFPGARLAGFPNRPHGMMHSPQSNMVGSYRCPNCGTNAFPLIERRISSAGWITFSLLLVFTVIFFWVGLLMKENVSVCPVCRIRLN